MGGFGTPSLACMEQVTIESGAAKWTLTRFASAILLASGKLATRASRVSAGRAACTASRPVAVSCLEQAGRARTPHRMEPRLRARAAVHALLSGIPHGDHCAARAERAEQLERALDLRVRGHDFLLRAWRRWCRVLRKQPSLIAAHAEEEPTDEGDARQWLAKVVGGHRCVLGSPWAGLSTTGNHPALCCCRRRHQRGQPFLDASQYKSEEFPTRPSSMLKLAYADALTLVSPSPSPRRRSPHSSSRRRALGCALAEPLRAPRALPAFDNSAMNGLCVPSRATAHASPAHPVALRVLGSVAMGNAPPVIGAAGMDAEET